MTDKTTALLGIFKSTVSRSHHVHSSHSSFPCSWRQQQGHVQMVSTPLTYFTHYKTKTEYIFSHFVHIAAVIVPEFKIRKKKSPCIKKARLSKLTVLLSP
uniref:Uncharacterized protein n=1 Tax=Sphaerodactylus townsendi TaxID=933632 RepID=A0ACB8EJX4_9SAUR